MRCTSCISIRSPVVMGTAEAFAAGAVADVDVVSVVGKVFDETWVWEKDVPVAVEGMLQ